MEIIEKKVSELIPYEKNAKKHDKHQVEQIAKSIQEFGFNQPIVIDSSNVVIVGHGRLAGAKKLKLETVPCLLAEKLTKEQIKAYRLADNKLNESPWDMKLVIDELKELDIGLIDLTGFSEDLILESEKKDDDIPAVPAVAKACLGDIYELGKHRIMCGDSQKIDDVDKLMDGKKPDMVFTDPPYGIDYQDTKGKHKKIEGDKKQENIAGLLMTTLINSCPMYICCNWKCYATFSEAMVLSGKEPKSCIVWDKEISTQNLDKFYKRHEFILYYGLFGGQKTVDGDVWRIQRQQSSDHPTAKPVELVSTAIKYTILDNQIVQDLFLGRGSTLIACEKTNRICYGMEIDPAYIDVIIKRWESWTGDKATKIK